MADPKMIETAQAINTTFMRRLQRVRGQVAQLLLTINRTINIIPTWRLEGFAAERFSLTIHESTKKINSENRSIMLISHDLTQSGAPLLLLQIALIFIKADWNVSLVSFTSGGITNQFTNIGVSVIIDRNRGGPQRKSLQQLGANVDAVICNTVETRVAVDVLAPTVPVIWYLHEVSRLEEILSWANGLSTTLLLPRKVWTGSELSAKILRRYRPDLEVVPYGLEAVPPEQISPIIFDSQTRVSLFGSYESRKGQDLLVEAIAMLPSDLRNMFHIDMFGRVLNQAYYEKLKENVRDISEVTMNGELNSAEYRRVLFKSDVIIVPSRDDTLPLVSLDALRTQRILMCTATTGTAAYVISGKSGYVAKEATARALADMLKLAFASRAQWPAIAAAGGRVFDHYFSEAAFASKLLNACASLSSTFIGKVN